ncbi:MAG: YcxB family protein [Clostridiales bacterium]|nr:YcxB family protein [Clostridiales bacterium]
MFDFSRAYSQLFIVLFFLGAVYLFPLGNYQKAYRKRNRIVYTFHDEQIETQSKDTRSEYAWAFFAKAHETPAAFLLVDGQDFVHIFPKRCFESEVDLDAFRELLVRKLEMLPLKRGKRAEKA